MSERHDSVHLEEKTKMPKTSAVWEHFKLSEDKTKGSVPNMRFETGLPQQYIKLEKSPEFCM